jgi:cardiolipin synthase
MDAVEGQLYQAIARAAIDLPANHVELLAQRISEHETPRTASVVTKEPPVPAFTAAASNIVSCWRTNADGLNGVAVASALRGAIAARQEVDRVQQVELAWTGPGTTHIRAFPTSDVLIQVIDSAQRELVLISFASTRVEKILAALRRAMERGVDISLLLENSDASEGNYESFGPEPFADIEATTYEWSNLERPRVHDKVAVMHAKIAIADGQTAFITSANLTGKALDHNMEAGVLVTGGPIPSSLHKHFRELAYQGIITPVDE